MEDHSTPIVTVDIWYDVGSRNERPGRSGLAHLFEHLMFQGSEHVAQGQHVQLIERAGGDLNANTNEDRTAFSQTLPASQLALGLWLEADRMRSLALNQSNLASQRDAVKEERRLRVDNQPYGAAFLDGLATVYDSAACFPYAHSVIGSLADLDAVPIEEVEGFFKLYYAPNNASLVVVGDFEPGEARRLVGEYFGAVPRGAPAPPIACSPALAAGARARTWSDPLAALPAVIVAYGTPEHSAPDTRALELLAAILGQGERSRLNRALVRGAQVAVQTSAGLETRRGPGLLYAFAVANRGATIDAVTRSLTEQLVRLRDEVSQSDLEGARADLRARALFGRQTTAQLAEAVQHYVLLHGSLGDVDTDLDAYAQVTVADLRRVATTYFQPDNSSSIVVTAPASGGSGGAR